MKKKVLILVIFILLILFTQVDGIKYLISDMIYFTKANENYVSKEYSIDIENSSVSGKNYAFWGTDKETDKLVYVIFVFKKGIYFVDGDEGVPETRVNEIASQFNNLQYNITLNVIETFSEKKPIIDYMYWIIEYEDSVPLKYIRFSDGIEENPFK
ncbi:hypothetical protein [Clostridium sp. DL1XJH146]